MTTTSSPLLTSKSHHHHHLSSTSTSFPFPFYQSQLQPQAPKSHQFPMTSLTKTTQSAIASPSKKTFPTGTRRSSLSFPFLPLPKPRGRRSSRRLHRTLRGAFEHVGSREFITKEEKSKWLPWHTLASSREFYLLDALLKHNVDINAVDTDGLSAVHKAILGKKQDILNYLLQ